MTAKPASRPRFPTEPVFWAAVIVILLVALLLRSLGLSKGIWLDEYYSILSFATDSWLKNLHLYDHQPPLYFVIMRLWQFISVDEAFLRIPSILCGLGALVATLVWLRSYSRLAGLVGAALCAALPILVHYSQEIRNYPLLILTTVLVFLFASRFAADPSRPAPALGLSLSLCAAVATHLVGVFLIPVAAVFVLAHSGWRRPTLYRLAVLLAAPSLLFLYVYFFWMTNVPDRDSWWMPPFSTALLVSTVSKDFGEPALRSVLAALLGVVPALAPVLLLAFRLVALLWLAALLVLGDWRRSWPLLLAALLFWIQMVAYSVFFTPIFLYRTVLPGLVPLIGFVAVQIATCRVKLARNCLLAGLAVLCAAYAWGWVRTEAFVPDEQWRSAGQSLVSVYRPGDIVIFYPQYVEGPLRYYTPQVAEGDILVVKRGDLPVNYDPAFIALQAQRARAGQTPRVFLIVRHDATVIALDQPAYHALLDYLPLHAGAPDHDSAFGNLTITQYGPAANP